MDRFNRLFQKSTQNTTSQLYSEMNRLVRLYASNLLKPEAITTVESDLSKLSFTTDNQLADDELGLGNDTWGYLAEWEEENDPKP